MKITFEQTTEDILDLSKDSSKKNHLGKIIWVVGIIFMLFYMIPKLSDVVPIFLGKDYGADFYIPVLIIVSIFGALLFAFNRFFKRKILFLFGDKARMTGPREVELTENEIRLWTPDTASAFKWSAISTLRESKKSYFLYLGKNQAIVIPKRAFENEIEESEFLDLVEGKIQ